MNTQAKDYYEYKVIEFKDESGEVRTYLCQVLMNGKPYGSHFEAKTIEQVFAWLRLMIGGYEGTGFNDNSQKGAVA